MCQQKKSEMAAPERRGGFVNLTAGRAFCRDEDTARRGLLQRQKYFVTFIFAQTERFWYSFTSLMTNRGISSAGRALAWHARGQRFDPAILHQDKVPIV